MAEALYNASGLGLPIVMTIANRAIGAPINIWNDHSDSMSQRDSGWIQLYAESNQEALDLHIQAFRIAEELSLPVMVCMDGFILTHAYESVDIPDQEQVDAFLPSFEPQQLLDPADPVTIGAMVGPEAFFEVKYLAHAKQMQALDLIPEVASEFAEAFGRASGGLLRSYRTEDAETIVVALGSVLGTIEVVIDEMREEGVKIGALGAQVVPALPARGGSRRRSRSAERVVVLEKALAVGIGGIVSANVRMALSGIQLHGYTVIAGLGGRSITRESLRGLFERAGRDELGPLELPRPEARAGRAGARPHAGGAPLRAARREHASATSASSPPGRTRSRESHASPGSQALPDRDLRGRQSPARASRSARSRPGWTAPTRSPRGTAPARAAARRSGPATSSTPPCAPPRAS